MQGKPHDIFDIEAILSDLPPERPVSSVVKDYGGLIDAAVERYRDVMGDAGLLRKEAKSVVWDLVVDVGREMKAGLRRFVEWADSVVPQFDSPAPAYAFATRGMDGSAAEPCRQAFVKRCDGCSLRVEVELTSASADMSVRMLLPGEEAISPFALTAVDLDSGAVLLDHKTFRKGAAVLRGVTVGSYGLTAEGGGLACSFNVKLK